MILAASDDFFLNGRIHTIIKRESVIKTQPSSRLKILFDGFYVAANWSHGVQPGISVTANSIVAATVSGNLKISESLCTLNKALYHVSITSTFSGPAGPLPVWALAAEFMFEIII